MITKILCKFGFHKMDKHKKVKVDREGYIYVLPEEKQAGVELRRRVSAIEGKCKRCGIDLENILNNEDIHIGI
jgi:hypothetical protein